MLFLALLQWHSTKDAGAAVCQETPPIIQQLSEFLQQYTGRFALMHGCHPRLRMTVVCPQVYEFHDTHSGMLCIAQPPSGVPAASMLASALSWALGSPIRLPLEPLLTCSPESLPKLQRALYGNGAGIGPSKHEPMKLASRKCPTAVYISSYEHTRVARCVSCCLMHCAATCMGV